MEYNIILQDFEQRLTKLQDVSSNAIEQYYSRLFAIGVVKMLMKLGVKEEEIYVFTERKKKLRQVQENVLGLCYYSRPISKGQWEEDGFVYDNRYWQVEEFFKEDFPNGISLNQNSGYLQITNMHDWSSLYNYLRIELDIPKGKRKVIIATEHDDLSKYK